MHSETESVAESVKQALDANERSGRWLARQLGKTHAWVHRRLAGEVEWSAEELRNVALVLGVPVSTFFGEPTAAAREAVAS